MSASSVLMENERGADQQERASERVSARPPATQALPVAQASCRVTPPDLWGEHILDPGGLYCQTDPGQPAVLWRAGWRDDVFDLIGCRCWEVGSWQGFDVLMNYQARSAGRCSFLCCSPASFHSYHTDWSVQLLVVWLKFSSWLSVKISDCRVPEVKLPCWFGFDYIQIDALEPQTVSSTAFICATVGQLEQTNPSKVPHSVHPQILPSNYLLSTKLHEKTAYLAPCLQLSAKAGVVTNLGSVLLLGLLSKYNPTTDSSTFTPFSTLFHK